MVAMSSFPLRRLPLLAISEVIKSMGIREIFLFSLVSKKSQNLVMLSIPKHSLLADFVLKNNGFIFIMQTASSSTVDYCIDVDYERTIEEVFPLMEVSSNQNYIKCYFSSFSGTSEVEESIRKLIHSFSNTFKSSIFRMKFEDGTREDFAMKLIKFVWKNDFLLHHIEFWLREPSSESIQELLNGCHEHHTSLEIRSKFPRRFKCTPPPGGYKFEFLSVNDSYWVNIDDFLQCRKVIFSKWFPKLTLEYLNGLLKKIVNLECRIESFLFLWKKLKPAVFAEIVDGLSESSIEQDRGWRELVFKRQDGLKLRISCRKGILDLQNEETGF